MVMLKFFSIGLHDTSTFFDLLLLRFEANRKITYKLKLNLKFKFRLKIITLLDQLIGHLLNALIIIFFFRREFC